MSTNLPIQITTDTFTPPPSVNEEIFIKKSCQEEVENDTYIDILADISNTDIDEPIQHDKNITTVLKHMAGMADGLDNEGRKVLFTSFLCMGITLAPYFRKHLDFARTFRDKMRKLIAVIKDHRLVDIYNMIFTDHVVDAYKLPVAPLNTETLHPLSGFDKTAFEKLFNDKLRKYEQYMLDRVPKNKFKENTIVGAKDKNGRWWLSRILKSFTYNGHVIYYVEFMGWGSEFNEFIYEPYRIEPFNPRKHKLYRSASDRAVNDIRDDEVVEEGH